MSAATITATKVGRRLKPYTLGHQKLLEFFESVFAFGVDRQLMLTTKEGLARLYADFIVTSFVCTHTYPEAFRKLTSRRAGIHLLLWKMRLGNIDLGEEIAALSEFIDLSKEEPKYWVLQDSETPPSPIPWVQYLISKLKAEFGKSDFEAENTQFQEAIIDYCVLLESKGAIRLMTEEDERLIKLANSPEIQAKLDAQAKAFQERNRN